jgi:hypothetical protein
VSWRVVDTGVLIIANGREEGIDPDCVRACVDALEAIQKGGNLVLDDRMLIFQEYQKHGSFSGQPGVGDAFFKWTFNNLYNTAVVELVRLTDHAERVFAEFPDHPDLAKFDRADRKFVATALKSANAPTLLIAVDSDWWDNRQALMDNGVNIQFLCPEHFQKARAHGRKQPRPRGKGA